MEKRQYELCLEVIRRFQEAGILDHLILIGSWCLLFYNEYFADLQGKSTFVIRTRDMDFLIHDPAHIETQANIPELLRDFGFVVSLAGSQGFMKLDHPDLIVEFLVHEKGRGTDKPHLVPALSVNATALRFLDILSRHTIRVRMDDFHFTVPHPAAFSLHKLIVAQRRTQREKALRDRDTAVAILKALIDKGEAAVIRSVFSSVPPRWRSKIIRGLQTAEESRILTLLVRFGPGGRRRRDRGRHRHPRHGRRAQSRPLHPRVSLLAVIRRAFARPK